MSNFAPKTGKNMVSIIVTFHNAERNIISCLQSLIPQTAQQWECVVIDNASTDESEYQVRAYLFDRRMRFVHLDERVSTWEARKIGLGMTKGEWVIFLDGNDYLESNAIQALYLAVKNFGTLCGAANFAVVRDGKKKFHTHLNDCRLSPQQVADGKVAIVTGNSIFSRKVAHLPESWLSLDFGFTSHSILISGEQEAPLVSVEKKSLWRRWLKW